MLGCSLAPRGATFTNGAPVGDAMNDDRFESSRIDERLELLMGLEPMTSSLPRKCSTN